MDEARKNTLVSAMVVILAQYKATPEEIQEVLASDNLPFILSTAVAIAGSAEEARVSTVADMVNEAREIWGDEAARQLLDKVSLKNAGGAV